jgi:hypothetical protein
MTHPDSESTPVDPGAASVPPTPVPPASGPLPASDSAHRTNGPPAALPAAVPPPAPGRRGIQSDRPASGKGKPPSVPGRAPAAKEASAPDAENGRHGWKENLTATATRSAPPWLVSSLIHMLLVIVLGLWLLPVEMPRLLSLELLRPESEVEGQQIEDHTIAVDQGQETTDLITPQNLIEVEDPFAAPPQLEIQPEGLSAVSQIEAPEIGLALAGRDEGMREALLGKYGGTGATEGAVALGLAWLAKQQRGDGSWSLKGPYPDGSQFDNVASATAMALLAFQGAGNTHDKGKYKAVVEKGMNFLVRLEDEEGNFFHSGPIHSGLYSQAQATIALCELYAMSQDSRLREPAERAIRYCVSVQDKQLGGWRYYPTSDSDTSVTGWFVMALQSARMGGLQVPSPCLDLVNQFLDSVAYEDGSRYSYVIGGEVKRSMTAEALLCRQWLGWERKDPRLNRGADLFVERKNLPAWKDRDVYYWYYATQVLHHLHDDRWHTWNHVMRELLPEKQEKKGPDAGSWHPTAGEPDQWGFHGGRLYVTCLSIYILEVYYRHLPLYADGQPHTVAGTP